MASLPTRPTNNSHSICQGIQIRIHYESENGPTLQLLWPIFLTFSPSSRSRDFQVREVLISPESTGFYLRAPSLWLWMRQAATTRARWRRWPSDPFQGYLWPPCVADADIIFLPSGFFFFYLFSSPNLSGRRLDLPYFHISCGLSANLECRSETCCTRLAEIEDAKIAIRAPSHNFVGLCLRN